MPALMPFYHVVAAIIWQPGKDNSLLISKRQKGKHLEDFWELPGGKLEPGESRLNGLRRELEEEINIRCTNARPFRQVRHEYRDRSILLDVWEVRTFEGVVKAREDQQVRWVRVENMGIYRFPEADQPIINSIANSVKAGRVRHP
jgi:8-oxo-dGTP diphosphatase